MATPEDMANLFSGAGAAIGDLGGSMLSAHFNKKEAKKSREFMLMMDNTRHQRAAADLEKAGLNRILALGQPGSSAMGPAATMPDAKPGSAYQAGSSAKAQRNVQAESSRLLQEQQTTEKTQQALLGTQAAAVAQKVESEIKLNEANAASALTAAKRGSGVAEISDAIADAIRSFRNPPPGTKAPGVLPYIADKLPEAVLGERGVNSAKKLGKTLYEKIHGTLEEQSEKRKNKWRREDAKKPKPKPKGSTGNF